MPFFYGYEEQLWDSYAVGHYEEFDIVIADECLSAVLTIDPSILSTLAIEFTNWGPESTEVLDYSLVTSTTSIDCGVLRFQLTVDYGDGNGYVEASNGVTDERF